jgi:hypothetical protein
MAKEMKRVRFRTLEVLRVVRLDGVAVAAKRYYLGKDEGTPALRVELRGAGGTHDDRLATEAERKVWERAAALAESVGLPGTEGPDEPATEPG